MPVTSESNKDSTGENHGSSENNTESSESTGISIGEKDPVSADLNDGRRSVSPLRSSGLSPKVPESNGATDYYYNQLNEEQKNFYNSLLNIVPPGNAEIPETTVTAETTEPVVTEPNITDTTHIKTEPPVVTTAEDDTITTEENNFSSSVSIVSDGTDQGTVHTDEDSGISNSITVTIVGRPGEDTGVSSSIPPPDPLSFSDVLQVIIIVLALAALFGFIAIHILKFARNEKK